VTLIVVGSVSALMAGAGISVQGWTTPPQWFRLIERISVYGSTLWVMVLALVLWRAEKLNFDLKKNNANSRPPALSKQTGALGRRVR
jgi:hypothetical protein